MSRLGKVRAAADGFLNQYKTSNPATYAVALQAVGGLLILDGFIGLDAPVGDTKRSGIFGSLIGVIVGLALIFGTGFLGNLFGITKLTSTTTATVVSVSQPSSRSTTNSGSNSGGACTARAKYTVDGKEYEQTSTSGSSSACALTPGQTININYNPNSPGAWAYDLNTVKTIFKFIPFIGIFVALTSLVTFVIRLLSIIFGWKLLREGRALAKTLPAGTDTTTIKNEIKQSFAHHLFGFSSNTAPAPTPVLQPTVSPEATASAVPPTVIAPAPASAAAPEYPQAVAQPLAPPQPLAQPVSPPEPQQIPEPPQPVQPPTSIPPQQ